MYSSGLEFDIAQFKSVMGEAPTKQNGWIFRHDGIVDQKFPESTVKIYNKQENSRCGFTTRIDAVLKGVKAKNIVLMARDIDYRKQADHPPKKIEIVEETKNADIIYVELDLPDPLHNRDLVHKRLFVGNKEDPELVRELGLFNWEHEYHAMLFEPTQRPEYPEYPEPIRGEMKQYMLLEEDVNDKSVLKIKIVFNMNLGGRIPETYMKAIRENAPFRMIVSILNCYRKFFGEKK